MSKKTLQTLSIHKYINRTNRSQMEPIHPDDVKSDYTIDYTCTLTTAAHYDLFLEH